MSRSPTVREGVRLKLKRGMRVSLTLIPLLSNDTLTPSLTVGLLLT